MPFEIATTEHVHRFRLYGLVTPKEWADYFAVGEAEERRFDSMLPRITDLSGVTELGLDFQLLSRTAQRRQKLVSNTFKSAIVAATRLQFGFARMWQNLCADSKIVVEIFPTVADALAWIREPGLETPAKRWMGPDAR
jgi:hypothetical protein